MAVMGDQEQSGGAAGRFGQARERSGMSVQEFAQRARISFACAHDLEWHDDEWDNGYSVADLHRFCSIVNAELRVVLGMELCAEQISPSALVAMIRSHCDRQVIALSQFEDAAGWEVEQCLDQPERLFEMLPLDAIKDICAILGIAWQSTLGASSASSNHI